MIEIIFGLMMCGVVAKIASADDQSGIIWFCITLLLGGLALTIPLPYLRLMGAAVVALGLMTAYKAWGER